MKLTEELDIVCGSTRLKLRADDLKFFRSLYYTSCQKKTDPKGNEVKYKKSLFLFQQSNLQLMLKMQFMI